MPVFSLGRSSQWNLRRLAQAGIAGCALALVGAPAQAQENTPESKILDSIMGAIGLSRTTSTIDYHERSPLVLPRDNTLPPPRSGAVNDPSWPVDPEIKQARAAAQPVYDGRTSSQRMDDDSRPLPASELNKGRTTKRQNNPRGDESGMLPSSWSELGYKGGLFGGIFGNKEDAAAKFTGEPARASLTAPPPGYQTPSPNQPYAVGKDKYTPKAYDYYTQHVTEGPK
jgi:hypothetical protein